MRGVEPFLGGPVEGARAVFEEMTVELPVADDIEFESAELGGVSGLWSNVPGVETDRVLMYFHGGALGTGHAHGYRSLWSELARSSGAKGLGVDYRLAPEHVFPAAVDDGLAVYRTLLDEGREPGSITITGDSAGGGLVVAILQAAKRAGLPMPAGAAVFSPWADLACDSGSMTGKADEDPTPFSAEELSIMAGRYLGGAAIDDPLVSPVHGDLSGFPPMLIQVGSVEILLDDATTLAARAGTYGVQTTLEVWAGMPHVWHLFAFMLDAGREAIESAGTFLSECYERRA